MSEYMLMFSLGPVQPFIAQARKTRDLWLGSFLLSKLMEAAMVGIEQALVFPDNPQIQGNTPDLTNKYVAIFDSEQQALAAAKHSEERTKEKWKQLCQDVQKAIIPNGVPDEARIIWDRQTNPATLFEVYWVIVAGDPNHYEQWLADTTRALNARKMLRNFSPQDEPGEKSIISGEREALHGKGTSRSEVGNFWKLVAARQSALNLNQEGKERLDAIDTVKRFATKSRIIPTLSFPSTSSIATASFVERLVSSASNSNGLKEWLAITSTQYDGDRPLAAMAEDTIPFLDNVTKKSQDKRNVLRRDGDCYFQETFTEYRLHEDYGFDPEMARTVAGQGSKALNNLLHAAREEGLTRPRSYYAMIQMDGDKMGILLSGVRNRDEHKGISEALSMFARETVPEVFEQRYPGRLIYAGGDDVFALAPLARDYNRDSLTQDEPLTVLDLVNLLQKRYCQTIRGAVNDEKRKDNVTASIGIAIAHHYTSLSYVRQAAKQAEERAKKHYGRKALVITILRRSGEQTQVGCHWSYDDLEPKGQPIPLFSRFYDLFKQDVLSPKCVYTLLEEAPALVGLDLVNNPDGTAIKREKTPQQSEIKRILLRQRSRETEKKRLLLDDEVEQIARYIVQLAAAIDKESASQLHDKQKDELSTELLFDKRRYGLVEVFGWLLVMSFLAREEGE